MTDYRLPIRFISHVGDEQVFRHLFPATRRASLSTRRREPFSEMSWYVVGLLEN
jgi:hypothetical protein